jgi:hypothetical protein
MDYSQLVKKVYIDTPSVKLLVNDIEVPMIVGTETEGGFYKNGYIAKEIRKGWLQVIVYTSRWSKVDIEERKLYNIKNLNKIRLVKWLDAGFGNIDFINLENSIEQDTDNLKYWLNRK